MKSQFCLRMKDRDLSIEFYNKRNQEITKISSVILVSRLFIIIVAIIS